MPTQLSLPWDEAGGGDGDDNAYTHLVWQKLFKAWHHQGGYVHDSGDGSNAPCEVLPSSPLSLTVRIAEGVVYVAGSYILSSDGFNTLSHTQNTDANDRIDLIVARRIAANQETRWTIIEGTPSASPVVPYASMLTDETATFDIAVAEITVPGSSATEINSGHITNVAKVSNWWRNASFPNGLSEGDLLTVDSTGQLVAVSPPATGSHYQLVYDNTLDPPYKYIDNRIIEVYGSIYSAGNSYVWTKNSFTTLNDPTGYASLSSGSLLLEAGTYLFVGAYQIGARSNGGNTGHGMRLYNNTAASVIAGQRVTGTETPVVDGVLTVRIGGQEFDSNGTDAYDSQYATNGTWIYNVQMTDPQHFYFRRIG